MLVSQNIRHRNKPALPAGVDPAQARPNSAGDISWLSTLVSSSATNAWVDTGIMPGTAFAIRDMIDGARDAIQSQLTEGLPGEAEANYTATASDTLVNSTGCAYFKTAKQIYMWGGGHGGWPGNEVYGVDLETQTWFRQTDPSAMKRNADGTWSNLDGTQTSAHTYAGIVAVEALNEFFVFGGAPWPLGGFTDSLWAFNIVNSTWRLVGTNVLGTELKRTPHMMWSETLQKLILGFPRVWRTYDPFTNTWGPVQTTSQVAFHNGSGMSVLATDSGGTDTGVYTLIPGFIDWLPLANIGTVGASNILGNYPQFTSYADWAEVVRFQSSYLWDPSRQMIISWSGSHGPIGGVTSDRGKRMWAIDLVNGKLYEFPVTAWTVGDGVGHWSKFFYMSELDIYMGINNDGSTNGWTFFRPGTMNLVAG